MFAQALQNLSATIFTSSDMVSKKVKGSPVINDMMNSERSGEEVLNLLSPIIKDTRDTLLELKASQDIQAEQIQKFLESKPELQRTANQILGKDTTAEQIAYAFAKIFAKIKKDSLADSTSSKETEAYKIFGKFYEAFVSVTKDTNKEKTRDTSTSKDSSSKYDTKNFSKEYLEKILQMNKETTTNTQTPAPVSKRLRSGLGEIKDNFKGSIRESFASGSVYSQGITSTVLNAGVGAIAGKLQDSISKRVVSFLDGKKNKDVDDLVGIAKNNIGGVKSSRESLAEQKASYTKEDVKEQNLIVKKTEEEQTLTLKEIVAELKKDNEEKKKSGLSDMIKDVVKNGIPGISKILGGLSSILGGGALGKIAYKAGSLAGKGIAAAKGLGSKIVGLGSRIPSLLGAAVPALSQVPDMPDMPVSKPQTTVPSKVASKAGGLLRGAASLARMSLPALAVGAAGTAGYAIGDKVVNPLLDKATEAITGKENSFGTGIADMFGGFFKSDAEKKLDEENRKFAAKVSAKPADKKSIPMSSSMNSIEPMQQRAAESITMLSSEKERIERQMQEKMANKPPVIIDNSRVMNSSNSSGNSGMSTSVKMVRNSESTFERVQMQNYWSRSQ